MIIYTVKSGDTLYTISRRYGVSINKIVLDNQLENPNKLVVGQALVLMTPSTHTVVRGDSLYSIASTYGVSLNNLISANPNITNPNQIYVGQVITIPTSTQNKMTIEVNGYAFPGTNQAVLKQTYPYLTYVSIFAYQVQADGNMISISDYAVLTSSRQANVMPLMVIANIKEGGSFDSDIAHAILTDNQVQRNLFENIISVLQQKAYYGVNVDFEYIYSYDRESYNQFLERLVALLRPLGYIVSTAVAPKLSGSQSGLLYEAHDYEAHGRIVDHVILMTYEWGYLFGPPLAVAPVDQVEAVVKYAVSVIPPNKILMGMPNYGYDWTLPYVKGSAARSISNVDAVNLAVRYGAEIQFDPVAQTPFFYYFDSNRNQHVVWFEDARSIQAKLKLVEKYKLGGVSYWNIDKFFSQNWLVLQDMFNVKKI